MKAIDWAEIKTEYVSTEISMRNLAKKHGVNVSNLSRRAKAESWVQKRKQFQDNVQTKTMEDIAKERASRAKKMLAVSDRILEAVDGAALNKLNPQDLKYITSVLKDIRDIQMLNKSELDLREQEARIKALEKQTEITEAKTISVELGKASEWVK